MKKFYYVEFKSHHDYNEVIDRMYEVYKKEHKRHCNAQGRKNGRIMDAISDRASDIVNQHNHMLRHGGNMDFPQYIDVEVSEEESETGETITVNIDWDKVELFLDCELAVAEIKKRKKYNPDYFATSPVLTSDYKMTDEERQEYERKVKELRELLNEEIV